jgi:hypothetical protein
VRGGGGGGVGRGGGGVGVGVGFFSLPFAFEFPFPFPFPVGAGVAGGVAFFACAKATPWMLTTGAATTARAAAALIKFNFITCPPSDGCELVQNATNVSLIHYGANLTPARFFLAPPVISGANYR